MLSISIRRWNNVRIIDEINAASATFNQFDLKLLSF